MGGTVQVKGSRFFKEEKTWLLFFFCFSLLIRLYVASPVAYSWDEVDFALAVERYDMLQMQPHFPGYPIFIVLAKLLDGWLKQPVLSLSSISAVSGSFSILVFYGLAKNLAASSRRTVQSTLAGRFFAGRGRAWAWIATLLYAVHPAVFLSHLQPMSEALGGFLVLCMLYAVSFLIGSEGGRNGRKPRRILFVGIGACMLYGLTLGVRLSYFPLGAVLLIPMWKWTIRQNMHRARLAGGLLLMMMSGAAAIFFWLIPAAATEGGLFAYWQLGKSFTEGHFAQWGGTVWSSGSFWPALGDWIARQWLFTGLTGNDGRTYSSWGFSMLLLFGIILTMAIAALQAGRNGTAAAHFGPIRFSRERLFFFVLWIIPYTGWVLFGQNVDKWRHLLPLYPLPAMLLSFLIITAGDGISSVKARKFLIISFTVLYLFALGAQSTILLRDYRQPQPVALLARFITQNGLSNKAIVYTWEEQRYLGYYNPDIRTVRLQTYSVFLRSLQDQAPLYDHIYLTNAVVDGFSAMGQGLDLLPFLSEAGRWRGHSLIDAKYSELVLYRLDRQFIFNLH